MKNFRMDLAYDGTDFEGWQNQNEGRTVQGELEKALATLHKKHVNIIGAGRTDSGVHARCMTAHFVTDNEKMAGENYLRGLNSNLPPDVRILDCREVPMEFHSRFSALARVYQYYILPGKNLLPWEHRYTTRINHLPDLQVLNRMAGHLRGELDFTSFSHAQDQSASKNRYIYHASWFMQGDKLVFRISGNAFLWRMVRSLVGSQLFFAERGYDGDHFKTVLDAQNRKKAGPTAPSQGLFLHKVIYDATEFSF